MVLRPEVAAVITSVYELATSTRALIAKVTRLNARGLSAEEELEIDKAFAELAKAAEEDDHDTQVGNPT